MSADICREYLIHSYLYYQLASPILSDHDFDGLCERMNKSWDDLTGPWKQFFIEKSGPHEGVGYKGFDGNPESYPDEIKTAADSRLIDYQDLKEGWEL